MSKLRRQTNQVEIWGGGRFPRKGDELLRRTSHVTDQIPVCMRHCSEVCRADPQNHGAIIRRNGEAYDMQDALY